jgi:hypothetical protein
LLIANPGLLIGEGLLGTVMFPFVVPHHQSAISAAACRGGSLALMTVSDIIL